MHPTTCKGFSRAIASRKREPAEAVMRLAPSREGSPFTQQMLHGRPFVQQLLVSDVHFFSIRFTDFQPGHDLITAVTTSDRRAIHHAFRDPVASIRGD